MAWIASTSFLRTVARLPTTSLSSPACRHIMIRNPLSQKAIPLLRNTNLLQNSNQNIFGCRALHASTPRRLHTSPVSRVRDYYSNGGSGGGGGGMGFLGRFWALVDRIPGKALVYGIIALDVGIWGMYQIAQAPELGHVRQWLRDNMMTSVYNIKQGRVWTLVTSAFSHVRTDHLLFNMVGLWMFCPSVAASVGSAIFLQVYLAGSIGCDLFSLFWNRNADERRTSVGASGALCSIMSFTACLAPTSTVLLYGLIPLPLWGVVVGIFLYDLYGSQKKGGSTTDFAGHIGGTLTGVGLFLIRNRLGIQRRF